MVQASSWYRYGGCSSFMSDNRYRNEVPCERDKLGTKAVDHRNSSVKRMNGKIRVVMEIAKQSDGETIQPLGPARQEKVLTQNARTVRLQQGCIASNRNRGSGSSGAEKLA